MCLLGAISERFSVRDFSKSQKCFRLLLLEQDSIVWVYFCRWTTTDNVVTGFSV